MAELVTYLASILKDYWALLAGMAGAALWASRYYQTAKHRAWTEEIVQLYRRTGQPIRVYLQDRAHLEWALQHGHLERVEYFEGGWRVIEKMQLGAGTPPAI